MTGLLPCRHCQTPVKQTRPAQPREFCGNPCRAAFRAAQHQAAMARVVDAIDHVEGVMGQALAQLQGARQLLDRFRKKNEPNGKKGLTGR